jgi:hypothetical protein
MVAGGGSGLIRVLDVEQQLEVLPSSHSQWPMWMSEMFDHAEMVEQVGVTGSVTIGLITCLHNRKRQRSLLPSSHSQWPMWMSEMFDDAEMVEQVGVTRSVTQM